MSPGNGEFHLTEDEQLLIQAAAAPAGEAAAAWGAWCERNELDDITSASFAILPAVAANLDRIGGSHPLAIRLRGVRRYAWTQNQVTLRDLAAVRQALQAAGVRSIAHRGLPIAERFLGDLAAIIGDQVDLLIAPGDLDRAAATLTGVGWRPLSPVPPARVRPVLSSMAFGAAGRRRVVLHWRCFPPGCPQRVEQGVIDRSLPVTVGHLDIAVPETTDAILAAAARLPTLGEMERVRWALETLMILRTGFDSAGVGHRASQAGITSECLEFVLGLDSWAAGFSAPAPASGTSGPPTHGDHESPGIWRRLMRSANATRSRYSAACRATGASGTPWGFLAFASSFYRHEWQVPPDAGVSTAAIRQLLRLPAAPGAAVPGSS